MLLWQPAQTTSNSEPAGTTVATGGPDSDDWHGGASEHRDGGDADGETRYQARGGAADGTGRERTTLQGYGAPRPRAWGACRLHGRRIQ